MKEGRETECSKEERRDFLRKSAYAAYATPVITAMLVEKASAARSGHPCERPTTTTRPPTTTRPSTTTRPPTI